MKMRSFYLVLLIAVSFLAACSSTSELTKQKWTITVSSGGGFTGLENGFTMIESGEVFRWSGREGVHEKTDKIGSVSASNAHTIKENLAVVLDSLHINSPGNMSTTVKLEEAGRVETATWGSTDQPSAPVQIKDWYTDFMQICNGMQGK